MNPRIAPLAAVLAALVFCGCAHHHIPGTEIDDTPDAHAILDVLEQYRSALEARDANRIIALVSESFHDNGGSTDPADSLDYASLRRILPQRLARLDDVRVELSIRKMTIDHDVANVIYYYNTHFRLPKLTTRPQSEGDLDQMWLKKVGGQWKILSGI